MKSRFTLLDRVLAVLRRHRQRHVLHRRTRIEIALVIGHRLRRLAEHVPGHLQQHRQLVIRHTLRDRPVLRVGHPVEAGQRADLRLLRHHAQDARIEVPAEMRGDDVARSLTKFLHRGTGAGRVVLDVLAQFDQVRPGLFPAVLRIHRVLVAQDIRQALQERPPRPGIRRPRIQEALGMRLRPIQQFLRRLRRLLHRVRHVFDDRAGRAINHAHRLVLRQALHLPGTRQVDVLQLRQHGGVVGHQRHPQLLVDARRKAVGAGQHQVDIDASRRLLRLQLARQFGRRRLREGDLRHQLGVRLGECLHRALGKLQLAGDVDDIERDRRGWQRRRRSGVRPSGAERGEAGNPAEQCTAVNVGAGHGRFSLDEQAAGAAPYMTDEGVATRIERNDAVGIVCCSDITLTAVSCSYKQPTGAASLSSRANNY